MRTPVTSAPRPILPPNIAEFAPDVFSRLGHEPVSTGSLCRPRLQPRPQRRHLAVDRLERTNLEPRGKRRALLTQQRLQRAGIACPAIGADDEAVLGLQTLIPGDRVVAAETRRQVEGDRALVPRDRVAA